MTEPKTSPVVGILGGSRSDFLTLEAAVAVLDELGVPSELKVVSAHRTPDRLFRYAAVAPGRGIKVFIAGAGGAAHLPGLLAAKTALDALPIEWERMVIPSSRRAPSAYKGAGPVTESCLARGFNSTNSSTNRPPPSGSRRINIG